MSAAPSWNGSRCSTFTGETAWLRDIARWGFRLRLQAWDRTLKDDEVDRVVEKIVRRLREGLGVEQRL